MKFYLPLLSFFIFINGAYAGSEITLIQQQSSQNDSIIFNFHFEKRAIPALFYFDIFNQQHYIVRPADFTELKKGNEVLRRAIQTTNPLFIEYLVLPHHSMVYVKPGDVLEVYFRGDGTAIFSKNSDSFNLDLFSDLSKINESLFEFQWNSVVRKYSELDQKKNVLNRQFSKSGKLLDSLNNAKRISAEQYLVYNQLSELVFLINTIDLVSQFESKFSSGEKALVDKYLQLKGADNIVSYRQFVYAYYNLLCKRKTLTTPKAKFEFIAAMPALNAKDYMLLLALKELKKEESPAKFNAYKETFFKLCTNTNYIDYVKLNTQENTSTGAFALLTSESEATPAVSFKSWLGKQLGNVVYIDFWASWCSPCRSEMPASRELRKFYKDSNVVFTYLSIDKVITDWRSANQEEFLSRYPNSFQLRMEQKDSILKNIDLSSIPRYVLINKAGEVVNADADRPGSVKIRNAISKLLNEH